MICSYSKFPLQVSACLFRSQVKDHETKESFGHALIPLTKREYMWFYRLMYNLHNHQTSDSELVFSNTNGGPYHEILTAFQNCWESFGLPGRPTFSLLRSSISTCVRRFHFCQILMTSVHNCNYTKLFNFL